MTNFTLKNPKWLPVGHFFFFSLSCKSCMIADLLISDLINFWEETIFNSGQTITEGCFRVRFRTILSS